MDTCKLLQTVSNKFKKTSIRKWSVGKRNESTSAGVCKKHGSVKLLLSTPLKEICQIVLYNSFVPYCPKVSEFLLTVRQKGQVFQDSSDDKDGF